MNRVLQRLFHADVIRVVIGGCDFVKAQAFVEVHGALLVNGVGEEAHDFVSFLAGNVKKFLHHAVAQSLTVIFGQQPQPFQLAHAFFHAANGARADDASIVNGDEKRSAVCEVVCLHVVHFAEFALRRKFGNGLFERIGSPENFVGDGENDPLGLRDFVWLNGADFNHAPILPELPGGCARYNPAVTSINASSEEDLRIQKLNFRYVQIDAVGVSISNVAAPFLPVFLTRLGASNFQVGLLSSMPGVTGLLLAIVVGRFLQSRRNIVPWYSLSRLLVILCYALTGILALILDEQYVIIATLGIWAFATIPQTALAVAFSVVMNNVAGPTGRYALLSRRWTIFGLTGVVGTFIVTRVIDLIDFPLNYAVMFLVLSLGGFVSFYFSQKITLPDQTPPPLADASPRRGLRGVLDLLHANPVFLSFSLKRFVYFSAVTLGTPIMPLFLVREVRATDGQIGAVNMAMTLVMLVGYFVWPRVSLRRSGRFVLLATTLGMVLHPALSALTPRIELLIFYAGIAGFFQGGLDLVFFDELMKTVPAEYSATFVSIAQSMQYLSLILAPLIGTWLAGYIGLAGALWVSAGLRFVGFLLFLLPDRSRAA